MNEVNVFCKEHSLTIEQFHGTVSIKRSLDLDNIKTLPDGFNPTVGGNLYLNGITSIPEGFSPTVGCRLFLNGLKTTSDIDTNISRYDMEQLLTWQDGKYRIFDTMFGEVLSEHTVGDNNVFKVKMRYDDIKYVVDNGTNYAHGVTIQDAIDNLLYKISARDTSEYDTYTINTVLTKADAVVMYRKITGACESGVNMFIDKLVDTPDSLTIKELIKLTDGEYGNDQLCEFYA